MTINLEDSAEIYDCEGFYADGDLLVYAYGGWLGESLKVLYRGIFTDLPYSMRLVACGATALLHHSRRGGWRTVSGAEQLFAGGSADDRIARDGALMTGTKENNIRSRRDGKNLYMWLISSQHLDHQS